MSDEPRNPSSNVAFDRNPAPPLTRWGRPLAITTAIVFVISSVFPVVAGFVTDRDSWPQWWGVLDVTIAFILGLLALTVLGFTQGKPNKPAEEASYRTYRLVIHVIIVLLVVFFLFGDRIVWSNCLTGFAWRYWLLLYGLPAWLTVLGANEGPGDSPGG